MVGAGRCFTKSGNSPCLIGADPDIQEVEIVDLKENLETIFSRLENMFRAKTVIGDPLTVGEITLVPVVNVTFGIGAGGGEGAGFGEHGGGGLGAGTGARLTPSAIVVIKGDQVSLLTLEGRSNLGSIIEKVPDLVGKLCKVVQTDEPETDEPETGEPEIDIHRAFNQDDEKVDDI